MEQGMRSCRHQNAGKRTRFMGKAMLGAMLCGLSLGAFAQASYIQIDPLNHNFGNVEVGQESAPVTVTFRNTSATEVATFNGFNQSNVMTSGFAAPCNTTNGLIQPGQACTFSIRMTPTAADVQNGSFTVMLTTEGAPAPYTAHFSVTGVTGTPATPNVTASHAILNFGSSPIGQVTEPQTVTLRNTGNADLVFSAAPSVSGDFSIDATSCNTAQPIAAGDSCTVTLRMNPSSVADLSGTLSYAHNGSGSQSVALSGTGLPAVNVPSAATPVPTLGSWAIALLSMVLAGFAVVSRRRA